MNFKTPVVGGWMFSSAKSLLSITKNIELAIATIYPGNVFKKVEIDNIVYYLLPFHGDNTYYSKSLEKYWKLVSADFCPDLVHLHGTEYTHGLAFMRACPDIKSVISIQGLVSVYARYYTGGMNFSELKKSITFRDFLKGSILKEQKEFYRRGEYEKEMIKRTCHVIGRTEWDKAQTWAINPDIHYHFCNETLRNLFYQKKWLYDQCERHTIFVSQASYPLKGLHQVLKALPIIKRNFPDTKVYVAGANVCDTSSLSRKIRLSGYGKYLKKIIHGYGIADSVIFTGPLNESQMCERFLKSNVYVCPSAIENSPNSLGEAQLLGMPCVASYVGGVPDLMVGFENWMYRFEEIEMLAEKICSIFKNVDEVTLDNQRKNALDRHNKNQNSQMLLNIYQEILNK